jgi:tryptophan synthase alpha chain
MELTEFVGKKRKIKHQVFMSHIYFGDPDFDFSLELVDSLVVGGIDILEFGMPFSDPTADGSTFICACTRALKKGITPKICIAGLKRIKEKYPELPVVVTSYFNIVFQHGIEKFVSDIRDSGAAGLIVPDAPIEESKELIDAGKKYNLDVIFIIGPYSTEDRIKEICKNSSGFLYVTSLAGVTGTREKIGSEIGNTILRIRKYIDIPVLVGFGISTKEHVKLVADSGADGYIAGSFIAKIYEKYIVNGSIINKEKCLLEIREAVSKMKDD